MYFYTTLLFVILSQLSYSQSAKADSLIEKFLLENKDVDTIVNNEKQIGNALSVEKNYSTVIVFDIHNRKCRLVGYKFGSNSPLRQKYILIDVLNKGIRDYLFLGKENFENDLKKLRDIFCLDGCSFTTVDNKKVLQNLMSIYADNILDRSCSQYENIL